MIDFFVGDHEWLHNGSAAAIRMGGLIFPTVHHAYLAAKTSDHRIKVQVAAVPYGGQLSSLGTRIVQQPGFMQPETMMDILKIKFGLTIQDLNILTQMKLAKKLIGTGGQTLEFGNHTCDLYWGKCHCSRHTIDNALEPVRCTGENMLGKLLMRARDEWRSYIEETNEINNLCEICSMASIAKILYSPKGAPASLSVIETCQEDQARLIIKAMDDSADRLLVSYDPDEKNESPRLSSQVALEKVEDRPSVVFHYAKKMCPHCKKLTPTQLTTCQKCYQYIGPTYLSTPITSTGTSSSYVTTSNPPERKYESEVIEC